MTRDEKLKAIEDMQIDICCVCPDDYGIDCPCLAHNAEECKDCWIKALEY